MGWIGFSHNAEIVVPNRALALNVTSVLYDGDVARSIVVVWSCRLRMLSGTALNEIELGLQRLAATNRYAAVRLLVRGVVIGDTFFCGSCQVMDLEPGDVLVLWGGLSTPGNVVLEARGLTVVTG